MYIYMYIYININSAEDEKKMDAIPTEFETIIFI